MITREMVKKGFELEKNSIENEYAGIAVFIIALLS